MAELNTKAEVVAHYMKIAKQKRESRNLPPPVPRARPVVLVRETAPFTGVNPPPAPPPLPVWREVQRVANPEAASKPPKPTDPPVQIIKELVAKHYGVRIIDMESSRRTANVVRPRQIAMYFCRLLTRRSLPEIGRKFGGRDHTTVLHAIRKMELLRATDAAIEAELAAIEATIKTSAGRVWIDVSSSVPTATDQVTA